MGRKTPPYLSYHRRTDTSCRKYIRFGVDEYNGLSQHKRVHDQRPPPIMRSCTLFKIVNKDLDHLYQ